jgi:hypothetical protein
MKGQLSITELNTIDTVMQNNDGQFDWLEWLLKQGYTGNEAVSRFYDSSQPPLWIYLMAHYELADWYRILEVCNVHTTDLNGENAFFYCEERPDTIPHLVRAGIDWRTPSERGFLPVLNVAALASNCPGPHKASLCAFIELYIEHAYDELAEITQWTGEHGGKSVTIETLTAYANRALDRHQSCRDAILTACLYLRCACRFPRDVANIIARLVWATRVERETWMPYD